MNKKYTLRIVILAILAGLFFVLKNGVARDTKHSGESLKTAPQTTDNEPRTAKYSRDAVQNSDLSKLRRKLAKAKIESKKEAGVVLNYEVSTHIQYGETLVMGGYLNEAGNHEITFLIPEKVSYPSGEVLQTTTHVIEMGPNFAGVDGMNDTVDTLKSLSEGAQAWTNTHVNEFFNSLRSIPINDLPSDARITVAHSPTIQCSFGAEAVIATGSNSGMFYELSLYFEEDEAGGVFVNSNIKRVNEPE